MGQVKGTFRADLIFRAQVFFDADQQDRAIDILRDLALASETYRKEDAKLPARQHRKRRQLIVGDRWGL